MLTVTLKSEFHHNLEQSIGQHQAQCETGALVFLIELFAKEIQSTINRQMSEIIIAQSLMKQLLPHCVCCSETL